jgi:hypothetical protein
MVLSHALVASDLTDRSDRALARSLRLTHEPQGLTVLHVIASGLPPELVAEQQRSAESRSPRQSIEVDKGKLWFPRESTPCRCQAPSYSAYSMVPANAPRVTAAHCHQGR